MKNLEPKIWQGPRVLPFSRLQLTSHIYQSLKRGTNLPCLIDAANEKRQYSFKQVYEKSCKLTIALQKRNIGPGDVIGIFNPNSIEYPIILLATLFTGAAFSPLNFNYTSRELEHMLSIITPKIVFCSNITEKTMIKAINDLKYKTRIINIPDINGIENNSGETFNKIINEISDNEIINFKPYKIQDPSTSVALIMCSSGTTGLPKAVQLSHTNIFVSISNNINPAFTVVDKSENRVTTIYLPLFHALGITQVLGAFALGNKCVILSSFIPDLFLRTIQNYKVKDLLTVPPLVNLLANSDLINKYDLSSVERINCGAAPLSKELQEKASKRLNVSYIKQGYGLTECTLAVLHMPVDKNKFGSSGLVSPGMECKVINEKGMLMGPKEPGELCFRGPLTMVGYKNNRKSTDEMIDSDGWVHTGDIGYYDEDGYFYIVDRLKELIKYKGFQVAPAELEALLQTHKGISDCAVIGVPDIDAGELPMAFVVKKDANLTEKQVCDFVAANVSSQKKLRGGVKFINIIPKSPSGKILRRELRDAIKSKL